MVLFGFVGDNGCFGYFKNENLFWDMNKLFWVQPNWFGKHGDVI
jgi:hypothetical protein